MPDTKRTLAALQALLADNETGDIDPQDVRDALISNHPETADGHSPPLSLAPSSPFTGQSYYNTTNDQLGVWDGAA